MRSERWWRMVKCSIFNLHLIIIYHLITNHLIHHLIYHLLPIFSTISLNLNWIDWKDDNGFENCSLSCTYYCYDDGWFSFHFISSLHHLTIYHHLHICLSIYHLISQSTMSSHNLLISQPPKRSHNISEPPQENMKLRWDEMVDCETVNEMVDETEMMMRWW